jgi:putative FmdB family regulatory protein
MPIFDYKCDKCEQIKSKLVSRSDADNNATFECDCEQKGTLSRSEIPTAAELRFRGRWFATTRGY